MGDLLLVLGLIVVTAIASGVLIPILTVRSPKDASLEAEVGAFEERLTVH